MKVEWMLKQLFTLLTKCSDCCLKGQQFSFGVIQMFFTVFHLRRLIHTTHKFAKKSHFTRFNTPRNRTPKNHKHATENAVGPILSSQPPPGSLRPLQRATRDRAWQRVVWAAAPVRRPSHSEDSATVQPASVSAPRQKRSSGSMSFTWTACFPHRLLEQMLGVESVVAFIVSKLPSRPYPIVLECDLPGLGMHENCETSFGRARSSLHGPLQLLHGGGVEAWPPGSFCSSHI